jgi:hypothetical protein
MKKLARQGAPIVSSSFLYRHNDSFQLPPQPSLHTTIVKNPSTGTTEKLFVYVMGRDFVVTVTRDSFAFW